MIDAKTFLLGGTYNGQEIEGFWNLQGAKEEGEQALSNFEAFMHQIELNLSVWGWNPVTRSADDLQTYETEPVVCPSLREMLAWYQEELDELKARQARAEKDD